MTNMGIFANAKKMLVAFATASVLVLAGASMAFADTLTVQATTPDGGTIDASVDLIYATNAKPVYGQYYKSNAWNVLATTNYVSLDSAIQAAVDEYNGEHETEYTAQQLISGKKVYFLTSDYPTAANPYPKYQATYADIYDTTGLFGVSNSVTAFTAELRSYTNPTGAVLAKSYGTGVTTTNAYDAAKAAANNQTQSDLPRLITGCSDDMTSATAMGKRYVFDVTGVIIK